MTQTMTALISVSDKSNIEAFAKELSDLGIQIISSGGTASYLSKHNVPVIEVSEVTKFPEMLSGRVKTLHPVIHGGILARRDDDEHMKQLKNQGINRIDIVVVNLYPFEKAVSQSNVVFEEAIENIDIGGPTLLRSSAKNFKDVIVLTDPADYDMVLSYLKKDQDLPFEQRKALAIKVFERTSAYDHHIFSYLKKEAGANLS